MSMSDEIRSEEILRALMSMVESWECDEELSVSEMTVHLEKVIEVFDGNSDYRDFLKKTGLKSIKYN